MILASATDKKRAKCEGGGSGDKAFRPLAIESKKEITSGDLQLNGISLITEANLTAMEGGEGDS